VVLDHVGFFVVHEIENAMLPSAKTMAEQIAQAATAFQEQRTGHEPKSVSVVLSDDTPVVRLLKALTPAEPALSKTPEGAARIQEFHCQLFAGSARSLRQRIERITDVEVRKAIAEVETATRTVAQVFTSGQVYELAREISAKTWNGRALPRKARRSPR